MTQNKIKENLITCGYKNSRLLAGKFYYSAHIWIRDTCMQFPKAVNYFECKQIELVSYFTPAFVINVRAQSRFLMLGTKVNSFSLHWKMEQHNLSISWYLFICHWAKLNQVNILIFVNVDGCSVHFSFFPHFDSLMRY